MTSFDFADSQYRFTSPVRYFKANDPIYYEVDNIPLKQLHENDLWLKDQIFSVRTSTEDGVDRSNINELRPYVDGFDNVVKVKPGRFTARINDAYNITPLQVITKLTGTSATDYNTWTAASMSASGISTIIEGFKQAVALNLNGLVERAFTRPAFIPDYADTRFTSQTSPRLSLIISGTESAYGQPPYALTNAVLWSKFNDQSNTSIASDAYIIRQYDDTNANTTVGFARMGAAETAFIKRWRGIARTSVVDIPEELSIEIPAFNTRDFFYYDSQGVKQFLTAATQRVDLLFIYSKPIDTSSTTVAKYVNGVPTTITRAELGIVYGAGLGVNFQNSNSRNQKVLESAGLTKLYPGTDDTTMPDGTLKMLGHFGDENGQNTGFNISGLSIKGSFPSPDDLMNLSPMLDEDLATNSISLVGQTVLPIAYVVVKKNSGINSDGSPILTSNDIVDIRPFFRTTELSYNERAGIAAAIPAPSIANPIVTQAELDFELKKAKKDIVSLIPAIPDIPNPTYSTFYYETERTIFLPTEILLKQGRAIPDTWGTRTNPQDVTVPTSYLVSASPVLFPSVPGEPTKYRRYCKELLLRAEGLHIQGDNNPTYLFVGALDGTSRTTATVTYYKAAVAGTWVNSGNAQNGGGYGGIPGSINTFQINFDTPPELPLIIRSYLSLLSIDDAGDPIGPVNNAIGNGTNNIQFKLYLVGYKIAEVARFKGIPLD
jgi:hypothetical protein